MPYIVVDEGVDQVDERYCVYKEGEDGKPTGEPLGCHKTTDEAGAQIGAIEAEEAEEADEDKSLRRASEGDSVGIKMDTLIAFGGELKALGDGRVGGYLVKFSGPADPDLGGDFFTAETDFGPLTTSLVFYEHGMDEVIKARVLDSDATLTKDDVGVWIEAQLERRDAYEQFIYGLAEQGRMGWSSGTASHLAKRELKGDASGSAASWIRQWVLGLDASLTVSPMEPRAQAIPLKTYMELPEVKARLKLVAEGVETPKDGQVAQAVTTASTANVKYTSGSTNTSHTPAMEENSMTPEELAKIEERFGSLEGAIKSTGKTLDELVASIKKPGAALGFAVDDPAPASHPKPFKSFGEQLGAVAKFYRSNGSEVDNRLFEVKATGASEGVPSDGGFLVQQDFQAGILTRAYEVGALASRCNKLTVSAGSNGMRLNAIDETSRASSRWGGIIGYWLAEAGTKLATKPKFRQIDLRLEKLIGLCYATDELLMDAAALEQVIQQGFSEEIAFQVDDAVYSGSGAGKPLGVMASPALVTVPKEAGQGADTVVSENISKMWARMWAKSRANAAWFINQDVEPQLDAMGVTVGLGGIPTYMPPGGLADAPYGRLKGRPVVIVEQASTVGDTGDILLADLSQYLLIDKGGVQAATSIHVQFVTDETAFRFVYRVDGEPVWNAPLTPFKGSNTLSPFVALAAR